MQDKYKTMGKTSVAELKEQMAMAKAEVEAFQKDNATRGKEVKEEVLDYEIGHVEEELVIIPVQENRSKNVKGFSDKRGIKVIHFADCPEGVLCELCSKQLRSRAD